MSNDIRLRIYLAFLIAFVFIPLLNAQQPPTEAPIPSQIAAAKKVFVSHGDTDWTARGEGEVFSGGPDRAYNQFYPAIKSWARYELVAAPADADLVLEISFRDELSRLYSGSCRFVLNVKDQKTQILLWSFSERIYPYGRQRTRDKNFDAGLNYIVDDLKKLVDRAR